LSAAVFAAIVGMERERRGMAAGLRTHMLVAVGCAVFTMIPMVADEGTIDPQVMSQIVRGVASGIGFLGAGAILKLPEDRLIKGLTTAATIWLTAAIGVAAGAGKMWLALVAVLLSLVILVILRQAERIWEPASEQAKEEKT